MAQYLSFTLIKMKIVVSFKKAFKNYYLLLLVFYFIFITGHRSVELAYSSDKPLKEHFRF